MAYILILINIQLESDQQNMNRERGKFKNKKIFSLAYIVEGDFGPKQKVYSQGLKWIQQVKEP